jgi:hypothetical protein
MVYSKTWFLHVDNQDKQARRLFYASDPRFVRLLHHLLKPKRLVTSLAPIVPLSGFLQLFVVFVLRTN